jgi:hypothetical protein
VISAGVALGQDQDDATASAFNRFGLVGRGAWPEGR